MDAATPGTAIAVGVAHLGFAVLSVVLTAIDLRVHRLPNALVLPAYPIAMGLLAVACLFGAPWSRLGRALVAAVVLLAFYAVLRLVSRRGLGLGDVKLGGLAGLFLGWAGWGPVLVGTAAGFVVGGAVAVVLLASGRASRATRIAFGPFLLAGAWAGILAGHPIAEAYLGL